MNPLVPLGIPSRIRLLILWLKNTHDLTVRIAGEVAPRTALGDHTRMHTLIDSNPDALDYLIKLCLGHSRLGQSGKCLGSGGSNTCGRVEDTVMYL